MVFCVCRGCDRYLGWLIKSPQATLPGYDPLVMSKAFMLRDAAALNPYNTKWVHWALQGVV